MTDATKATARSNPTDPTVVPTMMFFSPKVITNLLKMIASYTTATVYKPNLLVALNPAVIF